MAQDVSKNVKNGNEITGNLLIYIPITMRET